MMTVDDVAQELGVSKQKGYRIIRQLNEELAAAGYMTVQAKVPRTYWCERFYTGKRNPGYDSQIYVSIDPYSELVKLIC